MTKFKKGLCIALAIILGLVALGAVATFADNDTKSAGATFKVGGLDPVTGKFVETDKSLYTEKAINAYGLRIEPDFESTLTYDVYYYNVDDILIEKRLGLTDVYTSKIEHAQYARIVIHPDIPDDVKEKDFKVGVFDVMKYASQLKITVSKDVSKYGDFENLFNEDMVRYNSELEYLTASSSLKHNFIDSEEGYKAFDGVNVDGDYKYYDVFIYIPTASDSEVHQIALFNGEGTDSLFTEYINSGPINKPTWVKITIEIPELDDYKDVFIGGHVAGNSRVYIYGYND